METEHGHVGLRTDWLSPVRGAERLRGIFNKDQLVLLCKRTELAQICRPAAVIHRHNRFCSVGYLFARVGDAHIPRMHIRVREDGSGAKIERGICRGRKRESGYDYLISLLYPCSKVGCVKRRCSGIKRYRKLRTDFLRDRILEAFNCGSLSEPARTQNARHRPDVGLIDVL